MAVAMTLVQSNVARGASRFHHYVYFDGSRWLAGCVEPKLAERLVTRAGFILDGGPVPFLCDTGLLPVAKRVGR